MASAVVLERFVDHPVSDTDGWVLDEATESLVAVPCISGMVIATLRVAPILTSGRERCSQ